MMTSKIFGKYTTFLKIVKNYFEIFWKLYVRNWNYDLKELSLHDLSTDFDEN